MSAVSAPLRRAIRQRAEGRRENEHILLHQDRAGYGKEAILKLARSIKVGDDLLYRMLRFYEAFPISAARRKLTWTHYRTLSRLPDNGKRLELEARAARENWSTDELDRQVRLIEGQGPENGGESSVPTVRPLVPKKGQPGIFRIVADGEGLAVDLGFACCRALDPTQARGFMPNDLVCFTSTGRMVRSAEATTADLYTYEAEVVRVVDGDTLWVKVWLNRPLWLKEKLRLRGLRILVSPNQVSIGHRVGKDSTPEE